MSDHSAATFFLDSWQTYRKVVAADYMYHVAIAKEIAGVIAARFAGEPFSLLDLGCGDAATLAPLLAGMDVRAYKGIDLCEPALAFAAENLKSLPGKVELAHQDILEALATDTGSYDVIHSAFALHHLSYGQKASFFQLLAPRLSEQGVVVLVDVVRETDESLPLYLERYCTWLRSTWSDLEDTEIAAICDHIENNDRPETFAELQKLAEAAGFAEAANVAQYGWHRLLSFRRGAARL